MDFVHIVQGVKLVGHSQSNTFSGWNAMSHVCYHFWCSGLVAGS